MTLIFAMPKTRGAHGNNASTLPDLSSKFSEEGKLIVQLITDHIDILKSEFTEKIKEKDKEIAIVKSELNSVRTRLAQLEERHDDAEAYERRDTLRNLRCSGGFSGRELYCNCD